MTSRLYWFINLIILMITNGVMVALACLIVDIKFYPTWILSVVFSLIFLVYLKKGPDSDGNK
ncbi:MAG: hypothetical protein COB41_00225 [Proteobacteria bacterium]|nr:MAG: hypothetical protein COB41_00225 [Pseudomonadota bacterium]